MRWETWQENRYWMIRDAETKQHVARLRLTSEDLPSNPHADLISTAPELLEICQESLEICSDEILKNKILSVVQKANGIGVEHERKYSS